MPGKMPHENGDGSTMVGRPLRRENPHKYLLYKPTFSQVIMFLSSGTVCIHLSVVLPSVKIKSVNNYPMHSNRV